MFKKDRKYIYAIDKNGEILAYIDEYQPTGIEDVVFIKIIAEREFTEKQWNIINRGTEMTVVLKRFKKWKFYDDYNEFFMEYFDAII